MTQVLAFYSDSYCTTANIVGFELQPITATAACSSHTCVSVPNQSLYYKIDCDSALSTNTAMTQYGLEYTNSSTYCVYKYSDNGCSLEIQSDCYDAVVGSTGYSCVNYAATTVVNGQATLVMYQRGTIACSGTVAVTFPPSHGNCLPVND